MIYSANLSKPWGNLRIMEVAQLGGGLLVRATLQSTYALQPPLGEATFGHVWEWLPCDGLAAISPPTFRPVIGCACQAVTARGGVAWIDVVHD